MKTWRSETNDISRVFINYLTWIYGGCLCHHPPSWRGVLRWAPVAHRAAGRRPSGGSWSSQIKGHTAAPEQRHRNVVRWCWTPGETTAEVFVCRWVELCDFTSTIVSRASWELLITSIVFSQHLATGHIFRICNTRNTDKIIRHPKDNKGCVGNDVRVAHLSSRLYQTKPELSRQQRASFMDFEGKSAGLTHISKPTGTFTPLTEIIITFILNATFVRSYILPYKIRS